MFSIMYFSMLVSIAFQVQIITAVPTALTRFAGMGYNALKANPEGDFVLGGENPGIKTTHYIFDHTYSEGKQATYNGQPIQVPDRVEFHASHSCASSSTTHAYSGQTSYKKELSLSVDASGSYEGLISAQFSLSNAMRQVRETTESQRRIVVQKNRICNYGRVRCKRINDSLTTDFKNAIRRLPLTYSLSEYMQFLDNWGTSSRGVTAGVSIGGASGSLSLSIDRLDESVNENTEIGESLMEFTIGSREEPSPIYTKVVMMNETLVDGLWAANEMSTIRLKKMNLETALRNYTIHKGAQIAADPRILIDIQWPRGQFSLIQAATTVCPTGMSSGRQHQDIDHWQPSDIDRCIRFGEGNTYYCTKTSEEGSIPWPLGRYCIARYGGICPSGFLGDSRQITNNAHRGPIPDGIDDARNTRIEYCCRSDGNHNDSMILPPIQPFALYRYEGACQKVHGMNPIELQVNFDDENSNSYSGNIPDGAYSPNKIYLCHYSPNVENNSRCANNPCQNNGTCVFTCAAYTCQCRSPYTGTNCEHWSGNLRVKARYGRNLPSSDPDSRFLNINDPYMEVIAVDFNNNIVRRRSRDIPNVNNPNWNQWLEFGRRAWKKIKVRVYDEDRDRDDRLSTQRTWTLRPRTTSRNIRLRCYASGYAIFDYSFL